MYNKEYEEALRRILQARDQERQRMIYEAIYSPSQNQNQVGDGSASGSVGGGGGGSIVGFDLILNFSANSPQANPFAGTVTNPSLVSEWNTFFNLPNKGTPFTSVLVSGDIVILQGSNNLKIKTNLFENAL